MVPHDATTHGASYRSCTVVPVLETAALMKETLVKAHTDIWTSEPTGTFSRTQMSHPSSPKARLSDSGLRARCSVSGKGSTWRTRRFRRIRDGVQKL